MSACRPSTSSPLNAFDPETFDPHNPDFIADPYRYYEWFRNNKPVHFVGKPYDSYWLFRYDAVQQVLGNDVDWVKNNPVESTNAPGTFRVLGNTVPGIFSADNPAHDEVRSKLEPLFLKAIATIDRYAPRAAAEIIRTFIHRGRVEFINAFALPLPADVLREVLGVEKQDWPMITKWVDAFVLGNDPTRGIGAMVASGTSAMAMRTFYDALLHGSLRRITPIPGGLLDRMLESSHGSGGLTREEQVANAVTLSIAGYISTTFLIGTGLRHLLCHCEAAGITTRELGLQLSENEELMRSAVWEMLRFDPPFQLVDRFAKSDCEIEGQKICAGDTVTAVVGSANRDIPSAVLPDQNAFDIKRFVDHKSEVPKVMTFGSGIHRCIGAPLMLKVAAHGFRELLTAMPPFAEAGKPQWQTDPFLRAVSNLPIELVE